jgi:hypothetical protein
VQIWKIHNLWEKNQGSLNTGNWRAIPSTHVRLLSIQICFLLSLFSIPINFLLSPFLNIH